MKLSIITINYNNLDGLKRTYESIVSQTCQDFEWIIIDGGSTDGSKEFIEEHQAQFAYWCSEPDKGVYNAMNKGIAKATGEYVNFMNSGDSFYDTETIANVLAFEWDADVLYGDTLFEYNDGKQKKIKNFPYKVTLSWLYHESLNHQSTFVKRKIIQKYFFDETYKIMGDRKLWLQLKMARRSYEHLGIIVARFDKSGISSFNADLWLNELFRVRRETLPSILNKSRLIRRIYSILLG